VSVLNDVRELEQRVASRLRELQPLIEEYNELRRVAERLGIDVEAAGRPRARSAGAKPRGGAKRAAKRRPTARKPSARSRPGGTRAAGAERRSRVLGLIERRPGITVPEISRELGVDPPPLYRVVRKLVAEGIVKKEGKSLQLS
jgi:hypothetical protein